MTEPPETSGPTRPKARERGRMRRRLREQQELREALLAELGALVFELHRHDRREPELLQAKAAELAVVDDEVRALADALDQEVSVTDGAASGLLTRCPECETLLSAGARFCSSCGAAQRPEFELDRAPAIADPRGALETHAFEPAAVEELGPEEDVFEPELEPEPEPHPEFEFEPEPAPEPEPEPEPERDPEPEAPAAPWLAEPVDAEPAPQPEPESAAPPPEPVRVKRPMSRLERTLRGKRQD